MNSIKNAEIFAAGTWNDKSFTEDDLDQIVSAFDETQSSGRVPIKFGHGETESEQPFREGLPALGWVENLRRVGSKLLADFSGIPKVVYEAIRSGVYKNISIELLRNAKHQGKRFPYLLDAVALLGADPPAVRGLADLQKLTLSRAKFAAEGTLCFTRNYSINAGDSFDMDELKKAIAERDALQARLAALESKEERSKITMAREKATTMLEASVREKVITPAQRDTFRRAMKIDDDSVVDLDFDALQALTKVSFEQAKKVMSSRQAFSRDPMQETQDDGTEQSALDTLTEATRAHAEKTGKDMFSALPDMLRQSPKMARTFTSFVFGESDR